MIFVLVFSDGVAIVMIFVLVFSDGVAIVMIFGAVRTLLSKYHPHDICCSPYPPIQI